MKVLLIFPSHRDVKFSLLPDLIFLDKGILPPLGVLYVATYGRVYNDHEIQVIDMRSYNFTLNRLYDYIKYYRPDVVGISSCTPIFYATYEIAKIVKEMDPGIHVNVGGPNTEIYPVETLSSQYIDSITIGEGEISFWEFMDAMDKSKDLRNVKGIGFKNENGELIINEKRPIIIDLDSLPFPDRALLPSNNNFLVLNRPMRTTTMVTSRGCPYNCTFCANIEKKYRQRTPENVIKEMKICKENGYEFIQFYDATFNISKKFVKDFCKKLIEERLDIKWGFTGRGELLDSEVIEMLKSAGCERIHMGIQSGSEATNEFLGRKCDLKKIQHVFRLCRKFKIETVAYFIIGCPYETKEDIKKTVRYARRLKSNFAQFAVLVPLPGTEIYERALREKAFKNDYFADYISHPDENFEPRIWEGNLNRKEIAKLLKYAYRSFYFSPYFVMTTLFSIRSWDEFVRKAYAGLILLKYLLKIEKVVKLYHHIKKLIGNFNRYMISKISLSGNNE